ncbi:MAG: lamin tail domain-containing protein [Planctomycetes bacterium]|nr:lamin tail domain-containing protein [Planctomycetota bacterium]
MPGRGILLLSFAAILSAHSPASAGVEFSEIMYHPFEAALEFIELVNDGDAEADISLWRLNDGVEYTFPAGIRVAPGERIIIARDRWALAAAAGIPAARILGNWRGALSDRGERIALEDPDGRVIDEVAYRDDAPFDPRADGEGYSLERICLALTARLARNWGASVAIGGTPLEANSREACPPPAPAATSPVIVNEIHYHPERDPVEEFIELYNRTGEAVDLDGWQLLDAVEHTFDRRWEPTVIPAHGFLVIAYDPAALSAASGIPVEEIAGPYIGKLSNLADVVVLADGTGALADRIPYSQDGDWPARADGLGPSLQRLSPDHAGSLPQNWDVEGGAGCGGTAGTCTFFENGSAVRWFQNVNGTDPGFPGALPWYDPEFDDAAGGWSEGRLAVGFDSRVPDGQPWVLTPSAPIAGLHSILLRIEFSYDPEASGCDTDVPFLAADWDDGFVAWLNGVEIARGGMQDPPGTVPAFDGQYRADSTAAGGFRQPEPVYKTVWSGAPGTLRAGRNVLAVGNYNAGNTSTDLYFTARMTLGAGPSSGQTTPGRANSVSAAAPPPFVASVSHDPPFPRTTDVVLIEAVVEAEAVAETRIIFDRGAGEETASMRDDGRGGDRVAGDGVFTFAMPAAADQTRVKYRIQAIGPGGCSTSRPRAGNPSPWTGYHVLDARPEGNEDVRVFHIFTPGALADLSCTEGVYRQGDFVDFRGRVYFDVGVKFRGETACNYPKKPLRVRFNKGDLFDGQRHLNFNACWNDKAMLREKIGFDLLRDAGVPYCETHMARVHTNGNKFHGMYFTIEDPSEAFLRRNGWDDDGPLYKARTPILDGNTAGYEPLTDSAAERIAEIGEFGRDLNRTSGAELIGFLDRRMDIEEVIDYQAIQVIIIDGDSVVKNWLPYLGPHERDEIGERFAIFAWDIDLSFGQMYLTQDVRHHDIHPLFQTQTYPFVGQGHHGMIHALLQRAPDDYFVKAYYGRMWQLLQEKFHPDILLPIIDAYDANTIAGVREDLLRWPRTWGSRGTDPAYWREDLKAWVRRRFDYLTAYLTGDNPTTGGRRFRYTPAARILFSEIHYHPEETDDLEFIELRSLEDRTVDLSGWRIPAIDFEFPEGSSIPAGGLLVVARDPNLLVAQKGIPPGVPIHGPYAGRLSDGGEELRLVDAGFYDGKNYYPETIDVVRYDDAAPWPTEADGEGKSLEFIDGDNDAPANWRASTATDGSPGRGPGDEPPVDVPFERGDANADGAFDLADAMRILMALFGEEALDCSRSADVDDSGVLDLADAVSLLAYLFASGSAPHPPFGGCGYDTTPDDLECRTFDRCVR